MWKPTISSDEIYHHGILGQRYGKRNGPPYPLDSGSHSSEEKKHGWKQSLKAKDTKARHKELAKKYKPVRKENEDKSAEKESVKKEKKPLFKKSHVSRKETKALLKRSKNPYYQRDVKEYGKMSAEEFQKEKAIRKKAYDDAEKALKEPSKSKGESIAKKELAETTFNRYVTMVAYENEIKKMRNKK